MADPRFFDNRGPFTLAEICAATGADPGAADGAARICDVAALDSAGPQHLAFCTGRKAEKDFARSGAGFCFIPSNFTPAEIPAGMVVLKSASVQHAFAAAARLFYPESEQPVWTQTAFIDPGAKIGAGVQLAPGVVLAPDSEIGDGTQIGPNTVIARGVTIGRNCRIGSNVSISHSHVGDNVSIMPGALIGQPGFGFASSGRGHVNIPQLGRVIIQDKVELGAGCAVDRGAMGDTVIGEGTKIDNLVHIAHNNKIGRHCIIAAQVGISGSCEIGDFVFLGGQSGVADHATLGVGARFAAKSGIMPRVWEGGRDYGGFPARLLSDWKREMAALAILTKRRGKKGNG